MARIRKELVRDIKRTCEKNGYYDSLRGRGMPENALIGLRKLYEEGFSAISRLKEKSPRKYKKYLEKMSESHKDMWRKERLRAKYGLERKFCKNFISLRNNSRILCRKTGLNRLRSLPRRMYFPRTLGENN